MSRLADKGRGGTDVQPLKNKYIQRTRIEKANFDCAKLVILNKHSSARVNLYDDIRLKAS